MTWLESHGDTWIAPGYRIHRKIREFTLWAWTPSPLRLIGTRSTLIDAQALAAQDAHDQPSP